MQARAARIGKHVEDIELGRQFFRTGNFAGKFMTNPKWMFLRHGVAGIESAESLFFFPNFLPLGFDQMKRILSAAAGHRAADTTQSSGGLNRGIIVCWQLFIHLRFNTCVQSANEPRHHWLRVLAIGRRPKNTLVRIVVLVVTCLVTFKFILLPIRIEGISMQPTYHTGQFNCINRLAYLRHEPQRGDIVTVRLAGTSIMYMKRIIGLPGETVSFHEGRVLINGKPLEEPYVTFSCDWEHEAIPCGPTQYYVVGDNRSMPFEFHTKGRAERDRIVGKLFL
jgi:signal peptidase I